MRNTYKSIGHLTIKMTGAVLMYKIKEQGEQGQPARCSHRHPRCRPHDPCSGL